MKEVSLKIKVHFQIMVQNGDKECNYSHVYKYIDGEDADVAFY